MKKKYFAFILSTIMAFSSVPAFAASDSTAADLSVEEADESFNGLGKDSILQVEKRQ